jgi:hypothetical protein
MKWAEIPTETACFKSARQSAVCQDWMVVCAVRYELVSGENSLLTGKLTGYFAISGLSEALLHREAAVPQRFLIKFPKNINRERFSDNRD